MALRRSYAKQPAPDKRLALREAFQALQDEEPTISDIIHDRSLPDSLLKPIEAHAGSMAGASGEIKRPKVSIRSESKRYRSDQKISISRAVNARKPAGPLKPSRALKPTGK